MLIVGVALWWKNERYHYDGMKVIGKNIIKNRRGRNTMSGGLTLGITSIGNLLISKSISKTNKEGTDEGTKINLSIPTYQRPYKWAAKNVNQLFDDVEEAINSNKDVYRVGTLILHKHKNEKDYNYDIVDGQQRIITFSLLLHCLKNHEANVQEISFLKQRLSSNKYTIHNIKNNYRIFDRKVANMYKADKDKFDKFAEYICEHCELVVVITENLSEAFQFFDSQNSRGKALYPHDLLKAYHLREMRDVDVAETERVVEMWENIDQKELARLFNDYLYCLKEWINGKRARNLTEKNIDMFKGITAKDQYPFAQYYKGAFAYADKINHSYIPFVTGMQKINPFQINAPIVAGKPFFEYAKHYFEVLKDIQNNNKYEGYYIKDNPIVATIDRDKWKYGRGNEITRFMFDTAVLLYVDRFCPIVPSREDSAFLKRFVELAFIWAYTMRLQYIRVGWSTAQNYIVKENSDLKNSLNIYKIISESNSPSRLLSSLEDVLEPLNEKDLKYNLNDNNEDDKKLRNHFSELKFYEP